MREFKDVLKTLREEKMISQKELAEELKLGYSTIGMYESGSRMPKYEILESIADYFNVDMNYLLGKTLVRNSYRELNENESSISYSIPVLGTVVAGIPITAVEEIIDYEEISEKMAISGNYFALKVKGNSMEPKMSDGDVVIVKQQNYVDNNQIAIVLVNGDEATVKKVKYRDNGIELIGFNSYVYPPTFYSKEQIRDLPVKIIGRVVELRAKF